LQTSRSAIVEGGIPQVKAYRVAEQRFDDPNLVAHAGLEPLLRLADAAGLRQALGGVGVPSPNRVSKALCVIAGMAAGADSIDDMDVLRAGGMPRLFGGIAAPSTLGTYLRSFTYGHARQLDAANRGLLPGLARAVPDLFDGADGIAFVDVDDTIREVHGYRKQAAGFGYTGVRGLNAQFACVSTPLASPFVAASSLRRGKAKSGSGAPPMAATAIRAARTLGASGMVLLRADSAYYNAAFIRAAIANQACFSVTARMDPNVRRAIAAIPETAWTPIHYTDAVWDDEGQCWVSDAEVAETHFTAFTSKPRRDQVGCQLVVRRVKRLNPAKNQDPLFDEYRHHAFVTNAGFGAVEADQWHRKHAIVEQVIEELKAGPLAHLPSGKFPANAAWVGLAVIAFNLQRALGAAAGMAKARFDTIRARLIQVPARLARTARTITMHLPAQWPWAPAWQLLGERIGGPPAAAA